jgi:hypothetical protein
MCCVLLYSDLLSFNVLLPHLLYQECRIAKKIQRWGTSYWVVAATSRGVGWLGWRRNENLGSAVLGSSPLYACTSTFPRAHKPLCLPLPFTAISDKNEKPWSTPSCCRHTPSRLHSPHLHVVSTKPLASVGSSGTMNSRSASTTRTRRYWSPKSWSCSSHNTSGMASSGRL